MNQKSEAVGWLAAISAFLLWGIAPIYFKAIEHIDVMEILTHRILWCVPVTILLMLLIKKPISILSIIKDRNVFIGLIASAILISINWYLFTWAVTHDQILSASLGYFINPILSIVIGVIILKEKLSLLQWSAVFIVVLGVANQIFNYGEIPWIALSLASTFAIYGFIKKQLKVDSLNGFLVETMIAYPFSLFYVIWTFNESQILFLRGDYTSDLLLMFSGIVTAVPLILFSIAAKKISLSHMGFLQFIAPSLAFILATQLYNETLDTKQLLSFLIIWLGLLVYLTIPIFDKVKQRKSVVMD